MVWLKLFTPQYFFISAILTQMTGYSRKVDFIWVKNEIRQSI